MKKTRMFITVLFFAMFSILTAQNQDYTNEPGYVDFGDLTQFESGESVTEIYLDANLLKMVAKIAEENEPEMADLLNGLKLIKVNSYEVTEENKSELFAKMESIDKNLSGKSWQRIVRRKGKNETAYVYVRTGDSDKFTGLVVLALEKSDEAAFVNIVGDIDLATIGKLTSRFNIPALHNVHNDDDDMDDKE